MAILPTDCCHCGSYQLAFACGELIILVARQQRPDHARMLVRHPRRNVLTALPGGGGIEEAAVAAGVQIGAALHADFIEGRLLEADALLAALVALEDFRTEAAGGAPSRRALNALALGLRTGTLRPLVAAAGGVRAVAASVLIALVFVLAIAHIHLTKT